MGPLYSFCNASSIHFFRNRLRCLYIQYGETPIALMQGIKQVFDPKNILNPGKVCF